MVPCNITRYLYIRLISLRILEYALDETPLFFEVLSHTTIPLTLIDDFILFSIDHQESLLFFRHLHKWDYAHILHKEKTLYQAP